MKVCDDGHEEIVFNGSYSDQCPICELLSIQENKIAELESSNEGYQEQIKDLNTELEETQTT